ncbi:hypothetical protein F5X68DRAFT_227254 [Plectosphaerella plurivora]|uniref:Transcription factor domain-containing protein n=1 Tax=Plectosphaerella plurivora TaxID=936078 RepID=A0A9P9AEN1_9PEZI|nr:hypothetical protein F5X68DRAFT_227254 [Plectosphaerella plurivora]
MESQPWWSMGVESTLDWPSLRPYNLAHIVPIPSPSAAAATSEGGMDYYQPDPTWASLQLPRHARGKPSPRSTGALDDPQEMTELVDRFMKYIHAKQPVVKPQVIYDQIGVVQEEGLGWDAATCLLLIACALGGICEPYNPAVLEDYSKPSIDAEQYLRSREYFDAARKRLGLVMGNASITGAQCFFLVAGYYVTTFEPLAAWRNHNMASIMCQHVLADKLVLEGIPKMSMASPESIPDNDLRKLFWSCLKTEREIANELGFDIANLHLLQYKALPSLVPDSEPYEAPGGSQHSGSAQGLTPEQHDQSWFYYLTDIALRKIEIQIESFFQQQQARQNDLTPETSESFYGETLATLADLDRQIMEHFSQLPACIAVDTGAGNHGDDDLREYLRLRMLMVRHCLSRPALHFLLHGVLYNLSDSLRAQAAKIAERALLIDQYLVTHGMTTHRHPGTWLGIRYTTRAALEMHAVDKAGIPGVSLAPGWQQGIAKLKIALTYWSAESRDAWKYLQWLERLDGTGGSSLTPVSI